MEKEFWRRITRDEIITDYNTKAVNVDAYQKRDNNSDTAGKGYKQNPTTDKQFALFDHSLVEIACVQTSPISFVQAIVEKASLVIYDGQFSF